MFALPCMVSTWIPRPCRFTKVMWQCWQGTRGSGASDGKLTLDTSSSTPPRARTICSAR
ncbi:unnamed protein product [Ectocarpus sp. CCAP 1310/34]|nr:unnamed protein product [Ectocarpus sp. CCAP 1310/34]